MQTSNVNPPVTVICRHMELTDAMRDYAEKKIEGLHLDYPRIIEARVVYDVEKSRRQTAEIILFCANHITIQAQTTHEDLYAAIDETISKIARRMRKHKTRLLKRSRPRNVSIRHLPEHVFHADTLDAVEETVAEAGDHAPDIEPSLIHQEPYNVRPLYRDEALLELAMTDANFVVFSNASNGRLTILYRRSDGHYGLIEPGVA